MLTRRENMASVIATEMEAKKQKCRKVAGKNARMHNKFFWTEEEKAVLRNGTPKEIYDLGQAIFSGPRYLTLKQAQIIAKAKRDYDLDIDMNVILRYNGKEAYNFINGQLKEMVDAKKYAGPASDYQVKKLKDMSMCLNISMYMDFEIESVSYGEAYAFIGKYSDTYAKFNAAKPAPAVVNRIKQLFAANNEGCELEDKAIYAFVDPDRPEATKQLINSYMEDLEKAKATFDRSTTLEPEKKERTVEDEEEDEVKERREIERILYKMYETIGESVPLNKIEEIKSIDDLREIGLYVKKFNNGLSPIFAFKGCKFFNTEEIAYITGSTEEYIEKYLG